MYSRFQWYDETDIHNPDIIGFYKSCLQGSFNTQIDIDGVLSGLIDEESIDLVDLYYLAYVSLTHEDQLKYRVGILYEDDQPVAGVCMGFYPEVNAVWIDKICVSSMYEYGWEDIQAEVLKEVQALALELGDHYCAEMSRKNPEYQHTMILAPLYNACEKGFWNDHNFYPSDVELAMPPMRTPTGMLTYPVLFESFVIPMSKSGVPEMQDHDDRILKTIKAYFNLCCQSKSAMIGHALRHIIESMDPKEAARPKYHTA